MTSEALEQASEFEMCEGFWNSEIQHILTELHEGKHRFARVQELFGEDCQAIYERYGGAFYYRPIVNFPYPEALMACSMQPRRERFLLFFHRIVKVPTVVFPVKNLMGFFTTLYRMNHPGFRHVFECGFLATLLHELDHLALGLVGASSFEEIVEVESVVWARTCSRALPAFAFYDLLPADQQTLDVWHQCGCDAQNPDWSAHIAERYGCLKNTAATQPIA